jgi:hypothetical protein
MILCNDYAMVCGEADPIYIYNCYVGHSPLSEANIAQNVK